MSYETLLQRQIKELEEKISQAKDDKQELQNQLNKLKLSEFGENKNQSDTQTLLKG